MIIKRIYKWVKSYLEFLLLEEIGQSLVKPYLYKKVDHLDDSIQYKIQYIFTTEDNDKYNVQFFDMYEIHQKEKYRNYYTVEYVTGGDNYTEGDEIVVNKGRFFKVIATVVAIIKDFISEYEPNTLKISPVSNFKEDKRRKNIYIRYIESLLPNTYQYKKKFFGDSLYISKKDK